MDKRINLVLIAIALFAVFWGIKSSRYGAEEPEQVVHAATPKIANLTPESYQRNKQEIQNILGIKDIPINDIRDFGYGAVSILAEIYKESNDDLEKARIAWVFWKLGWQSVEIEEALMADLDAEDEMLKVNVQWGIARSAQSTEVLKKVIYNLENDPSAYVRDKAACALASDFVHISPIQRLTLLRGLVNGLKSDITQVRNSSILALKIQTGQTKNFVANSTLASRTESIDEWEKWLKEYELNL